MVAPGTWPKPNPAHAHPFDIYHPVRSLTSTFKDRMPNNFDDEVKALAETYVNPSGIALRGECFRFTSASGAV